MAMAMHSEPTVDDQEIKTLYVGNLPLEANETLLVDLFQNLGPVMSCKIIRDGISDPYCFIEYADQTSAMTARTAMDGRNLLGKSLKVNWATSSGMVTNKTDTSKHYHVFVGDLSPDISTQKLKDAFCQFGEISDCRVVKDLQTLKSKGYGFVSFVNKQDAENALTSMNGQWLGSRVIRTNWATRKPVLLQTANKTHVIYAANPNNDDSQTSSYQANFQPSSRKLTYNEVASRTTPTNATVYCGGIQSGLTEQLIRDHFSRFGDVADVRVFKDKGYAFIKFYKKDAAVNAIINLTNTVIGGFLVKCSWGKENVDSFQGNSSSNNNNGDASGYSNDTNKTGTSAGAGGYMSPYIFANPQSGAMQMQQQAANNYAAYQQQQHPNMIVGLVGNQAQSMTQNYPYAASGYNNMTGYPPQSGDNQAAYQMQYNNSSSNTNKYSAASNMQQSNYQYNMGGYPAAAAYGYYNMPTGQYMSPQGMATQGWTAVQQQQQGGSAGGYVNPAAQVPGAVAPTSSFS